MTETTTFNHVNIELICRVCFSSSYKVRLATFEEINALQNLDLQKYFYNLEAVHLCIFCSALLKKFLKFRAQCKRANQNFELCHEKPATLWSLSISQTDHQYAGPIDTGWLETQSEEKNKEIIQTLNSNISFDDLVKEENDGPIMYNDTDISEDDVPIRTRRNKKKEKASAAEEKLAEFDIKIETQLLDRDVSQVNSKVRNIKGRNKNGFSSRMVSETDEYVVIKLSKEQVLQEIKEKLTQCKFEDARYKCERCAKGFNFEDVYNKHMEKHQYKEDHLICDMCQIYCPTAVSLRGHIKSHTTRYKCKVCGCVRAGRQHLEEHFSLSHSAERRQYTCKMCTFVTDKRTTMIRHTARHRPSEGHPCEVCAKLCRSEEALRVHRIRHDSSQHYKCPECEKRFIYVTELKKHVTSVHERREHYCVECDTHFNSADNLKHHFKRSKKHRDPSIFSCRACPKHFESQKDLNTHLEEHKSTKRYFCTQCDKNYVWRDSLRSHVKRVHIDNGVNERFPCTICDKVFKAKSVLTRHRRAHSVNRPAQAQRSLTKQRKSSPSEEKEEYLTSEPVL